MYIDDNGMSYRHDDAGMSAAASTHCQQRQQFCQRHHSFVHLFVLFKAVNTCSDVSPWPWDQVDLETKSLILALRPSPWPWDQVLGLRPSPRPWPWDQVLGLGPETKSLALRQNGALWLAYRDCQTGFPWSKCIFKTRFYQVWILNVLKYTVAHVDRSISISKV